jgi:hypothetical protein
MINTATIFETREQYLLAAINLMKPLFTRAGFELPPVHVSTGFPSTKALSAKNTAIGQCWPNEASEDKVNHIFISPLLPDAMDLRPGDGCGVLPTLLHEGVHAAVGCACGHKGAFRKAALALGLDGKMTATHAGPELRASLEALLPKLGKYPHSKLEPTKSGRKKQGTRMIKCECLVCGYAVRTTKKWLEVGVPSCPCGHGKLHTDFEAGEDDE